MQHRLWDKDKDYSTLVSWWEAYEFGNVPKELLPPLGVIVEDDKPLAAAGLYVCTGTTFGFMDWVVVNPTASIKQSHKALTLCLNEIMKLAEDNVIDLIYTCTKNESLWKRYEKYHDMKIAESGVKTFYKDLSSSIDDFEFIIDEEQWNKLYGGKT